MVDAGLAADTAMRVILQTRLSLEECVQELAEAVDPERRSLTSPSGFAGSRPFIGSISGGRFRVWKRRGYRSSFAPVFYGVLKPATKGTHIVGCLGMSSTVKAILLLSIGGSLAAECLMCAIVGVDRLLVNTTQMTWMSDIVQGLIPGLVQLPIAIGIILAVACLAAILSREERRDILRFVAITLRAGPTVNSVSSQSRLQKR
jgi:hypothetical protein